MAGRSAARGMVLLSVVALIAIALVVMVGLAGNHRNRPDTTSAPTVTEPPTAVAPPDPGADPPPLGAPPPPGVRPQQQFQPWAESMSEDLNIPRSALEAYGYAAQSLQVSHPDCGMSWSVLAGIGSVESSHGRYGGARLDDTGRPDKPIRGLPLDGSDGVKRIEDTDDGQLDGDREVDRAVGPLQFIPSTWQRWGRDADNDGIADPHDLDDAALSAGAYLCEVGGDLRDPDRFWSALLVYNESHDYVQHVVNWADHYGKRSWGIDAHR